LSRWRLLRFLLIKFGENLVNVTTIGFVDKLTPFNPDEELLHPIFVVSEFMIQFLLPAIKCKPVKENKNER